MAPNTAYLKAWEYTYCNVFLLNFAKYLTVFFLEINIVLGASLDVSLHATSKVSEIAFLFS